MKKAIVLFLTIVLAAGTLFASGQQGGTSETAAGPRYPNKVDPWEKYAEPIDVSFSKETNTATDFPRGDSYSDNVWTRNLLEELGINMVMKFEAVESSGAYNTKVNLAIASNDLPDILTLPKYSQFSKLHNAGKLEDLTEAYNKFFYPVARDFYEEDGGVRKSWGMIGDKIFGMSAKSVDYQSQRLVHIRKDWKDELGLADPKSMDDVLDIARAFKAADPENRFGILINNEIVDNNFADVVGIANSMGVYPRRWIEDSTGKLVYGSVQPGFKDVLAVYNQLWNEGLLDPEFAVKNGGACAPTLTNSQVGVIIGAFWVESWPLPSLYESDGADWEIYPIMAMEGYPDKVMVQTNKAERKMWAVKKGFENPEALFKILNFQVSKLNDPETAETDKYHSSGDYNMHMWMPLNPAYAGLRINLDTNPNVTNAVDKNDKSYLVTPHDFQQYEPVKRYADAVAAGEKPGTWDWVAAKFFYGPKSSFGILNDYWNNGQNFISPAVGIETEEMARRQDTLNKLEEKFVIEIIMGEKPLDAFDEWVQQWNDLGGELIEYEINAWYDSVK